MTPQQQALVKSSFEKVLPIADTASALFYGRLFELDPSLRRLFKGDLKEQGRKLMSALKLVVAGLDDLNQIVPAVQHLGRSQAKYGVKARDYNTAGAALLWTLEQGLGEAFTPETRAAWAAAYELLATTMKDAAANEVKLKTPMRVTATLAI